MVNIKLRTPAILLISLFISVLLVGGTIPYFLFYIFLLFFITPLIHCLLILKSLMGGINIPSETLYILDTLNINYSVKNKSIFSIPYLEIENNITKELSGGVEKNIILSLRRNEIYENNKTITLMRRGYYEFGELTLIIKDVFGLYTFRKKVTIPTSLLVYPNVINLSNFKIITSYESGDIYVESSLFKDRNRISSLKEYQEGDSIRDIHWKMFAKKDFPIIKDYENSGDTNISIYMDNESKYFKDDVDRRIEDKFVDISLSIVDYCLMRNIGISLETQSKDKEVHILGNQISDFKGFLDALARFKGNGSNNMKYILQSKTKYLDKGATVILITSNLDKSMGAEGIELKRKNLNPLFIVVTDTENNNGNIDPEISKRLIQEGIQVRVIDYKTNIQDVLEVNYD